MGRLLRRPQFPDAIRQGGSEGNAGSCAEIEAITAFSFATQPAPAAGNSAGTGGSSNKIRSENRCRYTVARPNLQRSSDDRATTRSPVRPQATRCLPRRQALATPKLFATAYWLRVRSRAYRR